MFAASIGRRHLNWLCGATRFLQNQIYTSAYFNRGTWYTNIARAKWINCNTRFMRIHKILLDDYASMVIPYVLCAWCFLFRSGIYIVLTVSILPQLSHIDTECIAENIHVTADTYLLSDPYNGVICSSVCNNGNVSKFDNATGIRYRTIRSKQNVKYTIIYEECKNIRGTLPGHYREPPNVLFIAPIHFSSRNWPSRNKKISSG